MIIDFIKIDGGLRWNGQDRTFTNQYLPNSYQIEGVDLANMELDNQIYMLCSNDSTIDGISFNDIQSEIAYIFNL